MPEAWKELQYWQNEYDVDVYPLNPLRASWHQADMHPDDLKTMWLCCECSQNFLFHSDVEEHRREFNHPRVMLCNLSETTRSPVIFVRGTISLGFKLTGKKSTVIIDYQYYLSTGAIDYVDVRYSDRDFQSKVESDSELMQKIDNYLRRILNEQSASLQKKIHHPLYWAAS